MKKKMDKKTLVVTIALSASLALPAVAAKTDAGQGVPPEQNGNPAITAPAGNAVKTEDQDKVMNQGEATQVQSQEQNLVQTQDGSVDKTNSGKSADNSSEQRKSQVANAVQAMLQVADRSGGIGQQVRVIAQNQVQNEAQLENGVDKIQSRSGFVKLLIGPDYGEIKNAQRLLEQNREQIRQLNQLRTQLSNQGDQQQLSQQISLLEQNNQQLETILDDAQGGFSFFGWLNRLLS